MRNRANISFPVFFMLWAEQMGWHVPAFHLDICNWLENRGRRGVLKVFRGAAKSTIFAVYQAWCLRNDPTRRFIDRGSDDDTAMKLSSDTKNVLSKHKLCAGMLRGKPGVEKFSVAGNPDARNASVTAYGILSNATGSRADEIVNDDPEVPKNIKTPEARATLRQRLAEETHILVPEGKLLYIGTPHTHDSIYDAKIKDGYESLVIPLFAANKRHIGDGKTKTFEFDFDAPDGDDLYVMVGRELLDCDAYSVRGKKVALEDAPAEGVVVDFYAGNVWPERFPREEVAFKRRECLTQNEWDSQYLLQAKPVHEIRLNPDLLVVYNGEANVKVANGVTGLFIDNRRMISARACWDCSLGKDDSDDSAFAVMFSDEAGHYYWHVLDVLKGALYEQVRRISERVIEYQIPGVTVKTRGIGGFLPTILRKEFRERGIACGIAEEVEKKSKVDRILSAFEPPLSGRFLHCSQEVFDGGLAEQMRDWVPIKTDQKDDLLDAGSGCILNLPARIGKIVKYGDPIKGRDWRPEYSTHDVGVEL